MRSILTPFLVGLVLAGCGSDCACDAEESATAGGEVTGPNSNVAAVGEGHSQLEQATDLLTAFSRLRPDSPIAAVRSALGGHSYADPAVEATRALCLQASEANTTAGNQDANSLRHHCSELFLRLRQLLTPGNASQGPQDVTGELTDSDPRVPDDDSPYDDYTVEVQAGALIEVQMQSTQFDTYLWLIGPQGQSFVQDDDGGEGTNSHILYTATEAGTHTVRANSYDGTGRGEYTLNIRVGTP